MTLKHISFHDSPVMRELARQAIKNGVVSVNVSEIIKKAASNKAYSPTGDLFLDLIKLADGLRSRGFIENAKSLEAKIFAYKKASTQYNAELSTAHPDGDVTMGEASHGLGDVETLESAHEKILEVVKKQPTGKQANVKQQLVANILNAADQVLNLKKKAQDISEETAEDVFAGKSATRVATIKEINDFLAIQFPKISILLKSQDLDPSKWIFKYTNLYHGSSAFRNLYAAYTGLNPSLVEKFFQDNEKLYGTGFTGDEESKIVATLQAYAQAKDFNSLINYTSTVSSELANKYFTGSQPSTDKKEYATEHPDKANKQIFRDNPNSVWKWYEANLWASAYDDFAPDQNKLLAAAREIQQLHYNNFQALFAEEKLNVATAKLQEDLKKLLVSWQEVSGFFDKNPELPTNITSIASLSMAINSQIEKIKAYREDGILFKKLFELATIMWSGWIPNLSVRANEVIQEITTTVAFLNTKPLNQGDSIVQDPSQAVALLMNTAKMYWEAGKKIDPKSPTAKEYAQNQRVTFNLAKAVKSGAGKPYVVLYETIKGIFPNATTYDRLVQETQNWMQESANTTGTSVDNFATVKATNLLIPEVRKFAEGLIRKKPSATVPAQDTTTTTEKVTTSPGVNRATLGLAKANMSDPKEAAVALMQQHLAYFAEALANENVKVKFSDYDPQDVAHIIRTGPKANPAINTYDGKWGPGTQKALELANKYLKQLKIADLDVKARYTNKITTADAVSAAKQNTSLLSQAIQMLGGRAGHQATTVYDRLPDHIDWNTVEYPLMQHRIPVTTQDMSNLTTLYDLVIKNNWAQPKYSKDTQGFEVEGLTAGNILFIVRWFQRRAQFIYNNSIRTDKTAASVARQYYDAAKKLEGQLAAFLSARGGITPESANLIVDIEALREYSTARPSSTDMTDKGEGRNLKGKERVYPSEYQYARYQQRGQVGEGMDWKSPTGTEEGPPIGPDGSINLTSRWFHGLDEKLGISHHPLLNPEMFRRYPAADLARTFYASAGGDAMQQAQQQALVATGLEVEGYDEGAGDYIVSYYDPITRRKTRTYAMRVPAYQRAYKARLTAGPMRSFGVLLQSISSALGPAIAEWMRAAQPNDAAKQAEEAWHIEWQRILGLRANEAAI